MKKETFLLKINSTFQLNRKFRFQTETSRTFWSHKTSAEQIRYKNKLKQSKVYELVLKIRKKENKILQKSSATMRTVQSKVSFNLLGHLLESTDWAGIIQLMTGMMTVGRPSMLQVLRKYTSSFRSISNIISMSKVR